ncbi:hypothetical protein FJT64_014008 [Amphibalanus amphitrite]|uniref:Uncharacterized protein n=1 Tax=Amphibalanus amphitrite TaxID=1232801 RepID=A0A6A4UYI8_AMPAM|nr:hypothetical protein FJT64_014008 [Amphibalanus amphitrite]
MSEGSSASVSAPLRHSLGSVVDVTVRPLFVASQSSVDDHGDEEVALWLDAIISPTSRRKTREKTRESSGGDSDEDVVPLLRTISVDDTPERELDPRARTNSIDPDEVFTASSAVGACQLILPPLQTEVSSKLSTEH